MRGAYQLSATGAHVQLRAAERGALLERLQRFDSETWVLQTAEVRTDKGKFVSTAWEVDIDGTKWWVAIGFERGLKTVMPTDGGKTGLDSAVTGGPLYDFVEQVNRELMIGEAPVQAPEGEP